MSQADVFLFSHFHVDHSSDFPALVFSSWFGNRKRPLPIFGPLGNKFMPSTTEFVHGLFSAPHGAWRYLSEMVEPNPEQTYELQPHNVAPSSTPVLVFRNDNIAVYAVSNFRIAGNSPGAKSLDQKSVSAMTINVQIEN
jgi:ribonuclease BN (tRNA processing enzyme)